MKFKKWNILRANLEPVIGSEQGKSRPVIIISDSDINDLLNTVNIIPITTKKEGRIIYPNEVLIKPEEVGLENISIALTHQIRTIDKRRFSHYYGNIDNIELQNEITEALYFQLAFEK